MLKEALREFIREELDRLLRRSAGFFGGMNIGKESGETVFAPPNLGDEITDKEKDGSEFSDGQRRQNGNDGSSGRSTGRHPLQSKMRRASRFNNPVR